MALRGGGATVPAMRGWCIACLVHLLGSLAADTACRVGGGLGVLAWRLGVRRRLVTRQLDACLGLQGRARARVARRAYATIGATFLELWTVGGPDGPERHLECWTAGWQRRLHRQGGCIYVTPHLGAWDLGAHGLVRAAGRLLVYAKAQHSAAIDAITNQQRERLGYQVLLARHGDRTAALAALRALRAGASLGLMADQKPADEEAVPARFLGHHVACHRGPGVLARAARVQVVPGLCVRRRAGVNVLIVGRPLQPRDEAATIQAVMDRYSAMIAAVPGQYFWHHRRFPAATPRSADDDPAWRAGIRLLAQP